MIFLFRPLCSLETLANGACGARRVMLGVCASLTADEGNGHVNTTGNEQMFLSST